MPAAFDVVPASAGFVWRLVGETERLLAVSAAVYGTASAARREADRFARAAAEARGDGAPTVAVEEGPLGAVWTLRTVGGEALGRAPAPEATAAAAEAAAEAARAAAAAARAPSAPDAPFDSSVLDRAVIAVPLLERIEAGPAGALHRVIVDLNLSFHEGREGARKRVERLVTDLAADSTDGPRAGVLHRSAGADAQYVVARLTGEQIRALVRRDRPEDSDGTQPTKKRGGRARPADAAPEASAPGGSGRAIYRIWPDFKVRALLTSSVRTVKADAARVAFSALGENIVWAVVDSGVDGSHPHFQTHKTLALERPLYHRDFTLADGVEAADTDDPSALTDDFGHGTHVAGIVAGEHDPTAYEHPDRPLQMIARERGETTAETRYKAEAVPAITGVAPKCKVLSLRVLDEHGDGHTSDIIAALQYVQTLNTNGRFLRVHGVNLSVGYEFDPEWFACGHSPLCKEVDLLVRSGVVVVVAAGNTGYGTAYADARTTKAGMDLSINDPGNAERAITVGATHRAEPHRFGVSYFSSKGPTGDGRCKPDLVAPGERVLSCAAGTKRGAAVNALKAQALLDGGAADAEVDCHYLAESGTSMAAPHVSGAVAAFLSVRPEFIGRADDVKALFLDTATDLGRDRAFQGRGLVDLLRAMQAV